MAAKSKPARFTLEFPGDTIAKEALKEKFNAYKEKMTAKVHKPVNHYHALDSLLDFWFEQNSIQHETGYVSYPQPAHGHP